MSVCKMGNYGDIEKKLFPLIFASHLEQVVELVAEILDKVHVRQLGEDQILDLLGERHLGRK